MTFKAEEILRRVETDVGKASVSYGLMSYIFREKFHPQMFRFVTPGFMDIAIGRDIEAQEYRAAVGYLSNEQLDLFKLQYALVGANNLFAPFTGYPFLCMVET